MDTPTRLHKLTAVSQLLDRLRTQTLDAQNNVIKAGQGRSSPHAAQPLPHKVAGHTRHDGGGHPGAGGPAA